MESMQFQQTRLRWLSVLLEGDYCVFFLAGVGVIDSRRDRFELMEQIGIRH